MGEMMTESTELLRRYVAERSEPAFAELVRRHIDLVYSAALRQVNGDVPAAQDVTQAVFADLARKAARLTRHAALTGWLYTSTRYLAAKACRGEQRRRVREQEAHTMNQLLQTAGPDPAWEELRPVLDDVMHELSAADREAVLLRYFESRPLAEIGAQLGLSENAARMRVDRALDKLRAALAKRGVTSTATALAAVLADEAVSAAPVGLAATVSHTAFAAGAAACGSLSAISQLLMPARIHLLLSTVVVAVLVTGPVWFHYAHHHTTAPGGGVKEHAPAQSNRAGGAGGTSNLLAAVPTPRLVARQNILRLRVVADDTGKPIPRATLEYWVSEKGQNGSMGPATPLTATELGVCEVPVARDTAGLLLLRSRTDGYVDTSFAWSPTRGELIPQEYTLRLKSAVSIGGRVVDKDGNPVAGAEVKIQVRDTLAAGSQAGSEVPHVSTLAGEQTVTDAAGRWRIARFAKQAISTISGGATHPDFVADIPGNFAFRHEAEEQLLAGTYVFKLDRGVTLRGVVLDPNGRPVPDAKVVIRALPRFRDTTSQTDGSFTLTGCKPGANQLRAEAKGFAPAALEVDLTSNPAPVRLTLQPGRLLRLRVLDTNGGPVPKATVTLNSDPTAVGGNFRLSQVMMSPRSLYRWQTDANGRLEWDSAPDRELSFDVSAPDHMSVDAVKARPDGQEHTITLPPALTISGTVQDAGTGRPVSHFRVITGGPSWHPADNTTNFEWSSSPLRINSDDGSFRETYTEPLEGGWFVFKFVADGYAPFVTRPVRAVEGKVHFAVALQAVLAATVTVVLPDGRPAADADIGLVFPGAQLNLVPGGFSRASLQSSGSLLSTDDQGRFILPADNAITRVIAAHPQGYAETTPVALAADPAIRLQPWGRLEGTFLSGGKPAAGRELTVESSGPGPRTRWFEFRVKTDADGHFAFSKVPPGKLKLVLLIQFRRTPLTDVDVVPGETKTVTIGAYTVTAHLGWPADLKREADWRVSGYIQTPLPPRPADVMSNPQAFAAWRETPEVKAAYANMQNYWLTETAEGEMMVEDVPAGSYVLSGDMSTAPIGGKAKRLAHVEVPFTVPADPPTGTLDLGEIMLKSASPD